MARIVYHKGQTGDAYPHPRPIGPWAPSGGEVDRSNTQRGTVDIDKYSGLTAPGGYGSVAMHYNLSNTEPGGELSVTTGMAKGKVEVVGSAKTPNRKDPVTGTDVPNTSRTEYKTVRATPRWANAAYQAMQNRIERTGTVKSPRGT